MIAWQLGFLEVHSRWEECDGLQNVYLVDFLVLACYVARVAATSLCGAKVVVAALEFRVPRNRRPATVLSERYPIRCRSSCPKGVRFAVPFYSY